MKRFLVIVLACSMLVGCQKPQEHPSDVTTATQVITEDTFSSEAESDSSDDTVSEADENTDTSEPDSDKVAAAYLSGDISGLSSMELELYDIAVKIIGEIITEGMSQEDMCIAIHDYIVTHGTYDKGVLNVTGKQKPYSHLAYGFLTVGEGVCSGYTMTFKMFADMLGIENAVVRGSALADRQEHAWNMVKLEDGNWYHIDCTWDDFVPDEEGRPAFHIYTLIDDETLASDLHFWDEDAYPKAESMDRNYFKTHGLWFESQEDIAGYVTKAKKAGLTYAEAAYPNELGHVHIPKTACYIYPFADYKVAIFLLNT